MGVLRGSAYLGVHHLPLAPWTTGKRFVSSSHHDGQSWHRAMWAWRSRAVAAFLVYAAAKSRPWPR